MAAIDDLIRELTRLNDNYDRDRADRAAERSRKISDATASLAQATTDRDNADAAYRRARRLNAIGTGLIPLGILGIAGAAIGGAAAPIAMLLAMLGTGLSGLGVLLKFFFASKKRIAELQDRLERAQRAYEQADDYASSL